MSDYHANSRYIVNKFFSVSLQVFRPYFVAFVSLGMFCFCEIPCKYLEMNCYELSMNVIYIGLQIYFSHFLILRAFSRKKDIKNKEFYLIFILIIFKNFY